MDKSDAKLKQKQAAAARARSVLAQKVALGEECEFDPSEPFANEHWELYTLAVLAGKDYTSAYRLAYPASSYNSCKANASRLSREPRVKERLAYLYEDQKRRLKMDADDIRRRLIMAVNTDPAEMYDSEGNILPVHKMPQHVRLCIERFECEDDKDKNKRTSKVTMINKLVSLQMLGKAEKMFVDRHEVEVKRSLEDILTESLEADEA